jgi:hypothetical protein
VAAQRGARDAMCDVQAAHYSDTADTVLRGGPRLHDVAQLQRAVRGQRAEGRGQGAGGRGQGAEGRGQGAEGRGRRR